jgi:plasmid stabilization system protein ParE
MKIVILPPARDDLADGFEFYESHGEDLGSYFLESLFSDIDSLILYAGIHRKVFGNHRLLSRRFPFAIYYSTEPNVVFVKAVLDCRRDPKLHRQRLRGKTEY